MRKRSHSAAAQLAAVAFDFTGAIVGGVVVGYFADRHFGTDPTLLIVCTLLGTTAGFVRMVQILQHFRRGQALEETSRER